MIKEKESLKNSYKTLLALKGHKDSITLEKDIIYKQVEEAKKWLLKKPDYLKFLQHLQQILHEKNIGIFSELLTFFVKDVLNKDKEIKLDLYTYHNLPALKIEASNNGHRESIYEGSGGSIANIVSTGLRLISLSRMNNRKFIILDEPDCWVRPQHVPLFAKIIGEISRKLKIQTVLISHHNWDYFKDYGRVIELKQDGVHLTTEILHDTEVDEYPADYIEEITIRRVMSHYDTTYKLHPYLTCIVGENDIGKSVIAPAMKSLSYGNSSDSYIKHNEKDAQVIVKTSLGDQMMWQRFLDTSQDNPQKVKYTLFEQGKEPRSEFNADDCPNFIQEKLRITLTENIDIHIGNQKQPVFLLSSDVKPQDRAKILSLGKESLIVQRMMETIKSKTKRFSQTVKEGELKYEKITRQLKHLENIETSIAEIEELTEMTLAIEQAQKSTEDLTSFIATYKKLSLINQLLPVVYDLIIPELKDTYYINELVEKIETGKLITSVLPVEKIDSNLEMKDTEEINKLIFQINDGIKMRGISKVETLKESFEIKETQEINQIIKDLESKEKILSLQTVEFITISAYQNDEDILDVIHQYEQANSNISEWMVKGQRLEAWKVAIDIEIKEFLDASGNKCPSCNQNINMENIKGHLND